MELITGMWAKHYRYSQPGLPAELWDAFASDDDSDGPIEDEHHANFDCPGYLYARKQFQNLLQSYFTPVSQLLTSLNATG